MPGTRTSLLWLLLLTACTAGDGDPPERPAFNPGPWPAELGAGAALFQANCSGCHGETGSGFAAGPPLLDDRYLAPDFPDAAILRAMAQGAPERRWSFGDMPPVRTVTATQRPAILRYVRWLQSRWKTGTDTTGPAGPGS